MNHDYKTPDDCTRCKDESDGRCPVCDWALFICKVCNGTEGTLPKECPGVRMTSEQEDAVYAGKLDFVDGKWVTP